MEQGNYERKLSKENIFKKVKDNDEEEIKDNFIIVKDGEKEIIKKKKIENIKMKISNEINPNINPLNYNIFDKNNCDIIEEDIIKNISDSNFENSYNNNNQDYKKNKIISDINDIYNDNNFGDKKDDSDYIKNLLNDENNNIKEINEEF